MKLITYIVLLCTLFGYSQKRYFVDCSNNTVIRDTLVVKELVFVSEFLPMSYNSKLTVFSVVGNGAIVSPSTMTERRPKEGENEPLVIVMGCYNEFSNLTIGKHVRVKYKCNEN